MINEIFTDEAVESWFEKQIKLRQSSNPRLWRTHASVLRANYPVTECLEKTSNTLVRKFYLQDHEIMEDRMIVSISADAESCDIQTFSNALGSFRGELQNNLYTITKEQFEFLKEIWK